MSNQDRAAERRKTWGDLNARQQQSGKTVKAFCEENGVGGPSSYAWRKRLKGKIQPVGFALVETAAVGQQQDLRKIGEEVSERYEYLPAQMKVIEDACFTYACACTVRTAGKPPQPIEKSTAGASLLAQVIVSKLADHLPLHRQAKMFRRHGIEIAEQTMCGWMAQCAELLHPLPCGNAHKTDLPAHAIPPGFWPPLPRRPLCWRSDVENYSLVFLDDDLVACDGHLAVGQVAGSDQFVALAAGAAGLWACAIVNMLTSNDAESNAIRRNERFFFLMT